MQIIQNILIWILFIVVVAIWYSDTTDRHEWDRFTLQDWIDLHEHFHWTEEPIPDFLIKK